MNNIEFAKEVKTSKYCPNDFDNKYKEFNFYQDEAYDTLLEFHRVCEKNKILYELCFGSLLGLIRDGGQIPWDYDIDVLVPYDQKKNLISALDKDLNSKYYYYCIEKDENCRHMIMRLAPVGYKTESLHVDVFFAIGTPDDEEERKVFSQRIRNLAYQRFYKKVKIYSYISNRNQGFAKDFKELVKVILCKTLYLFRSNKKILGEYQMLCQKYSVYDAKMNVCADFFATDAEYLSKNLWKTKLVNDSNGNSLRVPVDYDIILKETYGDYHKIFPIQNRIKEVMSHYEGLHKQNEVIYKNKNIQSK